MRDLEGRTAVVTGGGDGIGRALAERFATAGMAVAIGDVDGPRAEGAAAELRAAGATALAATVDVGDAAAVEAFAQQVHRELGAVHLLCNNAGIVRPGTAWSQRLEDWDLVLRVNLMGVVHGLRSFLPDMISRGEPGHVVNTASVGGFVPSPGMASYATTKHAVVGLTETLRAELEEAGHDHLGVSALCPGGVTTGFWRAAVVASEAPEEPVASTRFAAAADEGRSDQTTPEALADLVVAAVADRRFWIAPVQPALRPILRDRHRDIELAVTADSAAAYPIPPS